MGDLPFDMDQGIDWAFWTEFSSINIRPGKRLALNCSDPTSFQKSLV